MRTLFFILLLVTQNSFACDKFVIGFKGLDDRFDNVAFGQYAKKVNACAMPYGWKQWRSAVTLINDTHQLYELYGYSKGAESIKHVLARVNREPRLIITVGAYHTAEVNYEVYGITTKNYFDSSGRLNRSPGVHVKDVEHSEIQSYVNKKYLNVK
jgi:hypothetical protein